MEWLSPALELVRTGSPYVSGGMIVAMGAGFLLREMRRHHAVESALWKERYDEIKQQRDELKRSCDETQRLYLASEREKAEIIRDSRSAVRKAGTS